MIYLQDFKKKKQPRVLLHLGSSQHSHAPEAWAGLRETLEGVPVIVRPRSHWGENWGTLGAGSTRGWACSRDLSLIPAPGALALAVVG